MCLRICTAPDPGVCGGNAPSRRVYSVWSHFSENVVSGACDITWLCSSHASIFAADISPTFCTMLYSARCVRDVLNAL